MSFATLVVAVTVASGRFADRPAHHQPNSTPGRYNARLGRAGRSGAGAGTTFDPATFGGDPTGCTDSTAAVQAALAAAQAVADPGGFIGNSTNHGGATVDLMGGQFAVSRTLWFGSGGGMRLTGGSLRATDNFTVGQPLVAVQGKGLEVPCPPLLSSTLAVAQQQQRIAPRRRQSRVLAKC